MIVSDLSDLPVIKSYLDRIGAEVRSMRAAAVREPVGRYSRDRAVIRLAKDGNVSVEVAEGEDASLFEPNDLERQLIASATLVATWPELQPLQSIYQPPPEIADADPDAVFEFRDEGGQIVMLQVRREREDGGKDYMPWTYWTDGHWRKMEPEGLLPLWGLDQLKEYCVAFIHEGAKAARAMARMTSAAMRDDKKSLGDHPWGQYLVGAAHLGWIGGAPNPSRTDWKALAKTGLKRVYIVADNDDPGLAAVPKIAKLLSGAPIKLFVVQFDDKFPIGFDLADAFPEKLFHNGRYTGPALKDCSSPATWATRLGGAPATTGRGRPAARPAFLRAEFVSQWIMVNLAKTGKALFVDRENPSRLLAEEGFNKKLAPFSDDRRLSALFEKQAYQATVDEVAYDPGEEGQIITFDGVRSVNLHSPSRIRAEPDSDPAPFLQFLENLFPEKDDRWEVMRWVATLIACPGIRMRYGLLLASTTQGVGKTTLCEILRPLVGEHNCSTPPAAHIVDSQFNGWIVRKRLVFVNEIYEGSGWKAYHRIKSFVTDDTLQANEKFVPEYTIRNWAHFILCSNATVPLKIEDEDRRFLVPTITEGTPQPEYWRRLYGWLDGGGYGAIRAWAEAFVAKGEKHTVRSGDRAPMTSRKRQLIDDSRMPEERMVINLAAAARAQADETGEPVVLVDFDVSAWLLPQTKRDIPLHTIRDWLKAGGLAVGNNRFKINGQKRQVAATISVAGKSWGEIQSYRHNPNDLRDQAI